MWEGDATFWASTIAAGGGLMTALFTGRHYALAKREHDGQVYFDWQDDHEAMNSLRRSCTIRNTTRHAVNIRHVSVKGPAMAVAAHIGRHNPKDEPRFKMTWINRTIPPGGSENLYVKVVPDLAKSRKAFRSGLHRPSWVSRWGWRLFSRQALPGVKFRISVIMNLNADSSRTKAFVHRIRMNEATMIQMEEKAAQSGA